MVDIKCIYEIENKNVERLLSIIKSKNVCISNVFYKKVKGKTKDKSDDKCNDKSDDNNDITLKKADTCFEILSFEANKKDSLIIENLLAKLNIKVISKKEEGFGRIVEYFKERYFLLIFLIVIVIYEFYSMSFLKNIEIKGNKYIKEDSIYSFLQENNIRCGIKMRDIDTSDLENKFYINYKNLKFITFDLKGTNMYIYIVDYDCEG